MKLERQMLEVNSIQIPALSITNDSDLLAIVIHGYGGNKEEIFGLSSYLSFNKIDTITIDLRGHGENDIYYTIDVMDDINSIIHKFRDRKRIVTVGHSIGGRLALLSEADMKVGISPALCKTYSDQTKSVITNLRKYRVKEERGDNNFKIAAELPLTNSLSDKSLVIYGSRDVPEIKEACETLRNQGMNVVKIEHALHNDIYNLNETFLIISTFLNKHNSASA